MMRTMFRGTAVGAAALMLGMLAGPAAAQEVTDEDATFEELCVAAVEAGEEAAGEYLADTVGDDDDAVDRPSVAELLEQGTSPEAICAEYGVEVLDVVIEQPPSETPPSETPPAGPPSELPTQAAAGDVAATEVLGRTLARTGVDAMVLALIGVGMVGLGVVAVRRKGGATDA